MLLNRVAENWPGLKWKFIYFPVKYLRPTNFSSLFTDVLLAVIYPLSNSFLTRHIRIPNEIFHQSIKSFQSQPDDKMSINLNSRLIKAPFNILASKTWNTPLLQIHDSNWEHMQLIHKWSEIYIACLPIEILPSLGVKHLLCSHQN